MTRYTDKSFSVAQPGTDPKSCQHKWQRVNPRRHRQECVTCGAEIPSKEVRNADKPAQEET